MTTNAFAPGVAEKIGFYVYLFIDPRDDKVFYVGKGTGDRCFAHLDEARTTRADAHGDDQKLARIRAIEASGAHVRIDILRHGLSEREAFLLESAVIELLGFDNLVNLVMGHDAAALGRMSVADVNARYGATPVEIDPSHRVILIRIPQVFSKGMTDEALYEATRKWWKVRTWTDVASGPEWAMAVHDGVVRAVYRIESWEQPDKNDAAIDPIDRVRWAFRGRRDPDMEQIYLFRDVSRYLRAAASGQPTQNPIRYVHRG